MLVHIVYKSIMALIILNKLQNSMLEVSFFPSQIHYNFIFLFQSNQKLKHQNQLMNNHVSLVKIHKSHGSLVVLKNLQVTWLFNGQPLPTNERYQITETEDGTSTLSIRNAELADKGVYTAKATNAVGEAEAKTTLNIAGIKPVITTDLDAALQATKGESMTIKLAATGTPKPDIVWIRGNDELVPSDRIQVTAPTTEGDDTYTLTILNVQPEDQGDYSAKITNVGGSLKSKKCKVTVTSKLYFL